ncbi:metacaspase 1 [Actinidia rufa]|uniref:Metacaspase 1 n=1 Tax=Actinidia rufa TaxID=165716 RepID=A0A7J0EWN3_9ERIC|nr:metacaspase 1 [Actinidia rufa]
MVAGYVGIKGLIHQQEFWGGRVLGCPSMCYYAVLEEKSVVLGKRGLGHNGYNNGERDVWGKFGGVCGCGITSRWAVDGGCGRWSGQYVWEDHRPRSGLWTGTNGGEVISFSGCDDDQTSADTSALSKITSTGAMTFCFIQAIERGHGTTYGSILNSMRSAIRTAGNEPGGGVATSLITMLLTGGSTSGGLRQEPQLTACQPFDVYTKPFSL